MGVPDASKGEALVLLTTLPLTVEECAGGCSRRPAGPLGAKDHPARGKNPCSAPANSISSAAANWQWSRRKRYEH